MGPKVWEAINWIASHEAMCEERSKTIFNRLENIDSKLESLGRNIFIVSLTLISGMAGIILTLLLNH